MARLLKGDKMAEPPRGRRLSFKTKATNDRKPTVRVLRKTVPSNSVAAIASKFNAIVVEDEQKGRAILKKNREQGSVRETVQKFETLQSPKIVVVRKTSSQSSEKSQSSKATEELDSAKPKIHPKPSIDRKSASSRYVKKDFKELIGKEKKLSLPKTQILDEILNGTNEASIGTPKTEKKKTSPPTQPKKSSQKSDQTKSETNQRPTPEEATCVSKVVKSVRHEATTVVSKINIQVENAQILPQANGPEKTVIIEVKKNSRDIVENKSAQNIKPNRSFLWAAKQPEEVVSSTNLIKTPPIPEETLIEEQADFENLKESSVDENDCSQMNNQECQEKLVENKENVEKLETPIIRTVDKKGYGKINIQANNSSLYRNILNTRHQQSKNHHLIDEVKERVEKIEKTETKIIEIESVEEKKVCQDNALIANESYLYKNCSEQSYEFIDHGTYEPVENENNYDVIKEDDEEAIYDDVHVNNERIYESIYNGRLQNDSDSSCEQNNSLYDLRPPSQASSGGSGGVMNGGAPRSDTSDDWVDIELDSSEEQKEQILVLQETPRPRAEGWSVKVRRQWSARSSVKHIYPEDSDSSSKHYELIENPDDEFAPYDDFEDSSDSEFSVDNNFKPNGVEERLQPEVVPSEGIYSLMKEAGKKMRKTSSTIGKSLRRISRMSKTTTAQDLFNGGNGMPRGRWPSFRKKDPPRSIFYLNDDKENSSRLPPPRPPAPTVDPRRLSLSTRPTSPPPPPPIYANGDVRGRATSLYAECGLFEQNPNVDRSKVNSWCSDTGLYENSRPSDTSSEHESSQGSDIDLRFSDEPLYQFYTESVAKKELSDDISETSYEEIGENRSIRTEVRPSALDLVSQEMQRTLWCHVPQVIKSGILDSLSAEKKKLQEAKFEVVTSEASYYKSLNILEKHFANSPLLRDETVLPRVHHRTLFGNVASVRECSGTVLSALDKCWQESILLEGLCDIVNQIAEEHFSTYVKYCQHQSAIERTLKTLKKTNQVFSEALDTLQKSPKCHNLTFYSFILLPMQRITRMPLLLDAILTKLTPDDPEYESCRLALARLNKIVHDCNEAARQTERLEEMALVSRSLHFPPGIRPLPLLSASRWLVRSGDLTQVSLEAKTTFSRKLTAPKSSKLRLFLFNDYLIVTKKKGDDNFVVVTYCERKLVQMSDVDEALPNRFLIMLTLLENHEGKTQEMVMCCGGESSRARWMSALSPPAPTNPGETLYEDWDCPQVCATHSYIPVQPDELSLQNGDVMNVLRKTADGWYYGERIRDAEKGWFPGNHTVEILSSHVRARNLKQRYRLLALSSNFIQKQQQQMNKPAS